METTQKIEFMMASLQVALEELEYKEWYTTKCKEDKKNGGCIYNFIPGNRIPNMTLVRENLKTVGRYSSIVAKEIQMLNVYL